MSVSKHTFESLCQYSLRSEAENKALEETIEYALFEVDRWQKALLAEQYLHSLTAESRDELLEKLIDVLGSWLPDTKLDFSQIVVVTQKAEEQKKYVDQNKQED